MVITVKNATEITVDGCGKPVDVRRGADGSVVIDASKPAPAPAAAVEVKSFECQRGGAVFGGGVIKATSEAEALKAIDRILRTKAVSAAVVEMLKDNGDEGCFVDDRDIARITKHLKEQGILQL